MDQLLSLAATYALSMTSSYQGNSRHLGILGGKFSRAPSVCSVITLVNCRTKMAHRYHIDLNYSFLAVAPDLLQVWVLLVADDGL